MAKGSEAIGARAKHCENCAWWVGDKGGSGLCYFYLQSCEKEWDDRCSKFERSYENKELLQEEYGMSPEEIEELDRD